MSQKTPTAIAALPLRLDVIAGPVVEPILLDPQKTSVIGRSSECNVRLVDPSVSRRHVSITHRAGQWVVADLGSRHGTFVNGIQIPKDQPVPIQSGDALSLGPWILRTTVGELTTHMVPTTDDALQQSKRIRPVQKAELASLAQHRLDLLLESAEAINRAKSEEEIAKIVLSAALQGTGFPRAAIVKLVGARAEAEIVAACDLAGREIDDMNLSRSLLQAAASGQLVRMEADAPLEGAQSIISLGIQSALCAPIFVGSTVDSQMYLDARSGENRTHPDAAAFCQAVARLCGLGLANLRRDELEHRNRQFARDLDAAREAQRLILPPEEGHHGEIKYVVRVRSGRFVAGDLFGVIPLDANRVAFFVGDVTGKGIGAGILMATAQSFLTGALLRSHDPAQTLNETNKFLCVRSRDDQFISLWIGILDSKTRTLTFVDAGHGYWFVRLPSGEVDQRPGGGGIPVAIDPTTVYESERWTLEPGSRIVLFSDGMVEQPSPTGEQFTSARLVDALRGSHTAREDVEAAFKAIFDFAQTEHLADDATIASIQVAAQDPPTQ